MSTDIKRILAQVATEADATRDDPMPGDAVATRPHRSVTVATRLAPEDAAEVEALAGRLDVPASPLLRGWMLAGLEVRVGRVGRVAPPVGLRPWPPPGWASPRLPVSRQERAAAVRGRTIPRQTVRP